MPETDWKTLLHVLQRGIVGGPVEFGAYIVAPVRGASNLQHTLQLLRAVRGVRVAQRRPIKPAPASPHFCACCIARMNVSRN